MCVCMYVCIYIYISEVQKGNQIPVIYMQLQMVSGRDLGLLTLSYTETNIYSTKNVVLINNEAI